MRMGKIGADGRRLDGRWLYQHGEEGDGQRRIRGWPEMEKGSSEIERCEEKDGRY